MAFGRQTDADVDMCLKAAAEAKFDLMIDRVLPLSEAAQAHRQVAERSGLGKVLLVPEE